MGKVEQVFKMSTLGLRGGYKMPEGKRALFYQKIWHRLLGNTKQPVLFFCPFS